MYMYPVVTTTELSPNISTTTSTTNMSRNRSLSATSTPPPALISRGFASLRRAHRRLSNSSPSSPTPGGEHINYNTTTNTTTTTTTNSTGLGVITDEHTLARTSSSENNNNTENCTVRPRIRLVPNVALSSRSFVFDIIDRELEPGIVYRIGRFSDRNALTERLSFKSKVVSRNHAEIWAEQGKVYLRDIGSSSGTFLNRIRLSPPSHVSEPHEIRDGDTVQLGVDYQGGLEPIYRAVRIRVEINRQIQNANSPFARTAFQQLRSHLIGTSAPVTSPIGSPSANEPINTDLLGLHREPTKVYEDGCPDSPTNTTMPLSDMMSRHNITDMSRSDIQECCICLYAIAPFQALFIAPCSHVFHFKCLRPIVFQNYPGFSCPLCRSYFDLEASVAIEVDEVLEAITSAKEQQQRKESQEQQQPIAQQIAPIDTVPEEDNEEEEEEGNINHPIIVDGTNTSSIQQSSSNQSEEEGDVSDGGLGSEQQHTKNKLSITPSAACITTPPVPYITIPDNDIPDEDSNARPTATSSSTQAIEMNINNDSQHLQAHPIANNRSRETLLSTTLVGSPMFGDNVLPTPNDNNNNIVS